MIILDGKQYTGGGQMIRYALAFSAVTNKPFTIKNIRAGRPKPGLRPQHLHAVKAMKKLCDAETRGAYQGSKELIFKPYKYTQAPLDINIGTAGSTSLVLQALLLPAFEHKKTTFTLHGGTDVRWSPPIDFTRFVLAPHLKHTGNLKIELQRRGYYPQGGGTIIATLGKKEQVKPITLIERGAPQHITCHINASRELLNKQVCETIEKNVRVFLDDLDIPLRFRNEYAQTKDAGYGVLLYATYLLNDHLPLITASVLGDEVHSPDEAASKVCQLFRKRLQSEGTVDEHVADHLIPFLALHGGELTTTRVSNHIKAACQIARVFTKANFTIKKNHITVSRTIAT